MKKQTARWGCLLGGLIILILLALGGGWWFFRSQYRTAEAPPPSPVLVFLLSPPSGDEMNAGDFVPVSAQAVAPESILSVELFVDGQSLGVVTDSPQNASWTWQAWPVGIHTLFARATAADGQVGQSQTVIVTVLAGDGVMDISAEEGQTLELIGSKYGLKPDQMAEANPNLNVFQPLPDGQPVQVPVSSGNAGGGGAGSGSGQGGGLPPISLIFWQFKPTEPVDKSYCYLSFGNGAWEKMPKKPFKFFGGAQVNYPQYDLSLLEEGEVIQAQCWGWLAGTLKFLGQGETAFDAQQPPDEVMVSGKGFVLVGIPQFEFKQDTGGVIKEIPPPFALREAKDAADCTAHGHPLLAPFICNTLLNADVPEYLILVWEWAPKLCLPGNCNWLNEIDYYRIYEIDPLTESEKYLKEVSNPSQKVTAIPLFFGYRCYGVRAYVNDPAIAASDMSTYCPGEPPVPKKITFTPDDWLTTGALSESWYNDLGNPPGGVVVSASNFGNETRSSAGVKFIVPVLPAGAVFQKAVLKFSILWTDYFAHGLTTNEKPLCVAGVGKAKQDWSGLNGGENHYVAGKNTLASSAYNSTFASLPEYKWPPLEVDVTPVVKDWIKNPPQNHGFIFVPRPSPKTAGDGASWCESGLGNFQLDIYYFAP